MTYLIGGINRTRDLVNDDIDKAQLGTDGTASAESDTGLISEDATTLLDITTTTSNKQIKIDYTLPSTGGTSTTYKEWEVQQSTTPVHYTRIVFTGLAFVSGGSKDILISTRWFYKRV